MSDIIPDNLRYRVMVRDTDGQLEGYGFHRCLHKAQRHADQLTEAFPTRAVYILDYYDADKPRYLMWRD